MRIGAGYLGGIVLIFKIMIHNYYVKFGLLFNSYHFEILKMNFNNLFVTVGTTKFKKLIDKFQDKDTIDVSVYDAIILKNHFNYSSRLKILKQLKCKQLIIQAGEYDLDSFDLASFQSAGIDVNIFNYANTLHEHMNKTDLIIGHAGKYYLLLKAISLRVIKSSKNRCWHMFRRFKISETNVNCN